MTLPCSSVSVHHWVWLSCGIKTKQPCSHFRCLPQSGQWLTFHDSWYKWLMTNEHCNWRSVGRSDQEKHTWSEFWNELLNWIELKWTNFSNSVRVIVMSHRVRVIVVSHSFIPSILNCWIRHCAEAKCLMWREPLKKGFASVSRNGLKFLPRLQFRTKYGRHGGPKANMSWHPGIEEPLNSSRPWSKRKPKAAQPGL